MAKDYCWNEISDNCFFILSEIKSNDKNFLEKRIERKKTNDRKSLKSFEQIVKELNEIYYSLYDVNFYVYKSEKLKTIIEIQYFLKSSLDKEFFEKVKTNEPMIHCKIANPNYQEDSKEKFDINWEHGGF